MQKNLHIPSTIENYRADLAHLAAFYREKRPDCDRFVALEKSAQTLEEMKGDS